MKEHSVSFKTMAIKARVYNQIRKDLHKMPLVSIDPKFSDREWYLTDKQKVDFFDKWFKLNHDANFELNQYKLKRKYKAKVEKLRAGTGYYKKKLEKLVNRQLNPIKKVK